MTVEADILSSLIVFNNWFCKRATAEADFLGSCIDLLTLMQIVNNFALEPYSKLCSFHNLFVNPNVCQISMRFEEANCAWNNWFTEVQFEDLEEIVAGGRGSFGVYW